MMTQEKSSFQGERGGDAYDAELLALLRGVSANSNASDRFAGSDDGDVNNGIGNNAPESVPKPASPSAKPARSELSRDPNEIPPWKQGKAVTNANIAAMGDEIAVATPFPKRVIPAKEKAEASVPATASPPPTNLNTSKSTFQGDRGGDAHDEELLALLRGISSKSGASDRFAEGDNNDNNNDGAATRMADQNISGRNTVEILVASPSRIPSPNRSASKIPSPRRSPSKIPGPSRSTPSRRNDDELPPWKRGKAKGEGFGSQTNSNQSAFDNDAVLVVAKHKPSKEAVTPNEESSSQPPLAEEKKENQEAFSGRVGNLQQKSTFQGDRGGDAHDEELLALLRGVSSKSSGADRFSEDDDFENQAAAAEAQQLESLPRTDPELEVRREKKEKEISRINRKDKTKDDSLPPWKRGKVQKSSDTTMDVVVASKPPPPAVAVAVAVAEPTAEAEISPLNQEAIMGRGGNLQQKSTFQGDRGGDAHDEELLALLRGVSSKSSSVDRFSRADETDAVVKAVPSQPAAPPPMPATGQSSCDAKELPPWKQGKAAKIAVDTVDVMVASKPPPATTAIPTKSNEPQLSQEAVMGRGGNLQQKSNFQGDRGGDAHDEELLALLRGVSSKSSSVDRFSGADEIEAVTKVVSLQDVVVASKPPPATTAIPTKCKEPQLSQEAVMGGRGNLQQKSNFQGDRGGDAHDEELLALLRGVSSKSSSVDRFAGGEGTENKNEGVTVATPQSVAHAPKPRLGTNELPPWKRGKAAQARPKSGDVVVKLAVAIKPKLGDLKEKVEAPPSQETILGGGGNFQQKSNFQGDRGGDAHDEELLALLRGVSAQSGGANRFGGGDAEENLVADTTQTQKPPLATPSSPPPTASSPPTSSDKKKKRWRMTPPWKKKNKNKQSQKQDDNDNSLSEDVIVVASPKKRPEPKDPPAVAVELVSNDEDIADEAPVVGGRGNFQQNPSNFQGERGGDAHDAELLALLRGASSSDRFAETNATTAEAPHKTTQIQVTASAPMSQPSAVVAPPQAKAPIQEGRGNFQQAPSSFKGERGGDAHDAELLALLRGASSARSNDRFAQADDNNADQQHEVIGAAPTAAAADENIIQGGHGNFKNESTFQGERGGDAHDEELLALLRGVSSSNAASSSDRFAELSEAVEAPPPGLAASESATPRQPMASKTKQVSSPFPSSASSLPPPFPNGDEEEIVVTLDDLPGAFSDKSFKMRKKAYQVLKDAIVERTQRGESLGSIDANTIVPGLDGLIPKSFAEKNAMALESAMQAGMEYANACRGGSSEEQAVAMMTALFKGTGLSSPRPTSAKAATALVLKLMEVGSSVASLKSVVSLLVEKGLTAKKPKVVQLSASLILDATHSFGAANLPLSSIASTLPKVLTHSNKKIRDTGMEIVAELCRSFRSKDPLEGIIEKMQKAQVKDLDALIAKRADPIPPKIGLRCQSASGGSTVGGGATCAADVFAALNKGNEELEKEKFDKRPEVKLMTAISETTYASQLQEAKWSKKVEALDMVLNCGGEKPYKLAPSSSSNNYALLISDMRGLLKHTHFAVVSKATCVLGMLAQGVGEKLYSNLRPLLPKLLQLTKDKKLTKAVSACLDACFGNVFSYEHFFASDSLISIATSESKEKNALARTSALDYLDRCVTRGDSAGPRASLTPTNAKACAKVASQKIGDSDANVRKSAIKILMSLQKVDNDGVQSAVNRVVEELQQSHPRAYKTLSKTARSSIPKATPSTPNMSGSDSVPKVLTPRTKEAHSAKSMPPTPIARAPTSSKPPAPSASPVISKPAARGNSSPAADSADGDIPTYEEALAHCGTLGIPLWEEPSEDEGGILVGIQSKKWQSRHAAIKEMVGFVSTCPPVDNRSQLENFSNCLLVVVKEHTRMFKEPNVYVARCILELFSVVCDHHERSQYRIAKWVVADGTALAVEKIADRKLSSLSKSLLLSFCVVHPPQVVIASACACAEKLRAPLAHEEFLAWMKTFCNEFGASSIGSGIDEIVTFLLSEYGHKSIKVKRAASSTIGLMHVQLGQTMKVVTLVSIKNPSFREEIEKLFEENPLDSALSSNEWPRSYILSNDANGTEDGGTTAGSGMTIELPKMDLVSELPSDCVLRMGSKDGKTAWKARKAALEDVEKALKSSSGLLDASALRPLMDLLRAMRERLSDSQSNLKPLAARLIGLVLGAVEGDAQGKLGKVVYGPVLNAAMNDKRKAMNDASMEALKRSTSIPEIMGEGLNENSLEPFVVALTAQLDGSEFKSAGIAGILTLTKSFIPKLGNLEIISSTRGETVGGRFSKVLVNALSSSKAEIRSAAESLLSECITNNVFSMRTAKKCMGRMVPAKQRTIGMILAKISSSSVSSDSHAMKEASPSKPPRMALNRTPQVERGQSKSMELPAIQKPKSTPRTTGLKSRLGTYSKSSVKQEEEDTDDTSSNPLVVHANPSGIQKSRAAMRSLTWPEYPEEPSGTALYNGLKKAWAQIIPPNSTKKLFPDKGIRNQSDVNDGFVILRQAIKLDKVDQGFVLVEQLHFILRWSVYVMGCKESAVGLTGLLDMLAELISYLNGRMHEFSDPEVSLFVPLIYEKASVAKGRFTDTYMDLIRSIKAGKLISDKRLGPLVCVPLMENSSQAKARLLACQTCHHCVEAIGLSGIGKKGVLVAAKTFSTEKLPENRTAFLDLMVLLVSKMHNDIQRLSKICGSSLSLKARGLIEEHMKKAPSPAKVPPVTTPSPQKPFRPSRLSHLSPPTKLSFSPKSEFVAPSVFEDELPALDLRSALRGGESPSATPTKAPGLNSTYFSSSTQGIGIASSYSSNLASSSNESDPSEAASLPRAESSPIGAAASLRARLLKIREKNNLGPLPTKPSETISIPMTSAATRSNTQHTEDYLPASSHHPEDSFLNEVLDNEPVLEIFLETIRKLLEKSYQIFENDDDLLSCTDVLKNIHAAVSKQSNLAVMISPFVVENLRVEIRGRASEVVGILTRLIRFGFNCHPESLSAGMSIPLLSVNLASLMAIFRSNDLATLVNVDDLTILIKEAGTALLDPRLAQSTTQGNMPPGQIDEATSTQMVRAINKLAVQAATGATRENSIQALIRLQDQLSSASNLGEDLTFNNRLSRVVTKLSTRVIKAEENATHPFSSSSMDMETVLCFLEDTLDACRNAEPPEGAAATKHIVKSVLTAILKARRECTSIRQEMDNLQIDPHSSALGELVGYIASDLGLIVSEPPETQPISENNDVSSLVSAVVSSSQGSERAAAINALKSYRSLHGDKELMNHLEDVSPAFRSYLVKELSESSNNLSPQRISTDAMSERIKNLRSKLNATDGTLSQGGLAQAAPVKSPPSKSLDQQQRMKDLRHKLNATQAALSVAASTFPPPAAHPNGQHPTTVDQVSDQTGFSSSFGSEQAPSSNPTISAFRERLAAAKEKQAAIKSSSGELASPMPMASASSRAAALRARLQAVKMQTNL